MPTKFNHKRFYISPENRKTMGKFQITTGMIINFKYKGIKDKKPLVFVMDTNEFVSPDKKSFSGINLNYLPLTDINKFFIRTLMHADWEKSKLTGLPKVNLWDDEDPGVKPIRVYNKVIKTQLLKRRDCWRTYKYNKVGTVEHVMFDFTMSPLTALKENKSLKKISQSTMYRKLRGPLVKHITYTKPNFSFEWTEARRYPEFVTMGKDGWIRIASDGYTIKYKSIKNFLGNVNLDFENLHPAKKKRFNDAYEKGKIEKPIVVKFGDQDYDLVAGNTRLSGLVNNGENPDLWVVDISSVMDEEENIDED